MGPLDPEDDTPNAGAGDPGEGEGDDAQDPQSIAERAANGEHEIDPEPPEPPMEGDVQLSLGLGKITGNRNARKVERATVSLTAAEREVDGLFDVDSEVYLLVRALPGEVTTVPIRGKDRITEAFKLRQSARTLSVQRAESSAALAELFARLLDRDREAAGRLLDELGESMKADLRAAA